MEIESDKEIFELEPRKETLVPNAPVNTGMSSSTYLPLKDFNMSEQIELKIDFSTFESTASALHWPLMYWPLAIAVQNCGESPRHRCCPI